MRFIFKTNGGPQDVEITDAKVERFIKAARNCKDEYGNPPEHPIDFCQLAYQLYLCDVIKKEDKDYLTEKFTEIMNNFKYEK